MAYAAAKLAGEQLCRALAARGGATSFAILRIGWCQPGAYPNPNPNPTPDQVRHAPPEPPSGDAHTLGERATAVAVLLHRVGAPLRPPLALPLAPALALTLSPIPKTYP